MLERPAPSDDKHAERDSPVSAALTCAYQLMQQRIISNPKDMMGILLFGTEQSDLKDTENTFQNCSLLSDLDVPCARDVKQLRDLLEDEEEAAKILKPSKERVAMSTVLFCANQIFTTKAPNFSSRRLFLVTDNDYPVIVKQDKDTAITRARDLYDLGCTIDLFPISQSDHMFDRTKFYDDLVYPTSPSDPDAPIAIPSTTKIAKSGDGISLLKQLLSSINSKAAPRRALFTLPLEIGPGLRIGVKGFILIKRQQHAKSCNVWVGGEKPQIVSASTTHMADDTARVVEKGELRKAYKFGGDSITFSTEEFLQIRQCFGDPIIRIIGFKPLSSLPIWANLTKATFMYPSEGDFVGSTRVFSALQQKLIKSRKMALSWFIARKNAAPVLAAIIPGEERFDENGEQTMPPGLWIVTLPFADDIRQCPPTKQEPVSSPELTDKMRVIMEQLQLPKGVYDPSKYPNPDLQWFYKILQAMALEEEIPEKADDKTMPKYRQIEKRAGPYIIEYGEQFEVDMAKADVSSAPGLPSRGRTGEKRPKAGGDDDDAPKPRKRIKKEEEDGDDEQGMTDEQMEDLCNSGAVQKQTVAVLKLYLKAKGLSTIGKKAELVERVQGHFGL